VKFVKRLSLTAALLFCAAGSLRAQTWTPLVNQPSFAGNSMWVMTDGTILVQDSDAADCWKLTPDNTGSYINGSWTQLAPMHTGRLYFASAVLPDGRLIVSGGEYGGDSGGSEITATEIYDPVQNVWTQLQPPAGWPGVGDAPCAVLPNGTFMMGGIFDGRTAVWDPATKKWTETAVNPDGTNTEENWTLLPGGAILTESTPNPNQTHEYVIGSDAWLYTGNTVKPLVETSSYEIGPAILMPNGQVFVVGATGYTGIYTPNTKNISTPGTWTAGPNIPSDEYGNILGAKDAPACLLSNGHVLFVASPVDGLFEDYDGPMTFFEFDGKHITRVPSPNTDDTQFPAYFGRLLPLPNGQAMWTDGLGDAFIYTPSNMGTAPGAPNVSSVFPSVAGGASYTITGKQFNGLSQAVGYGDDYTAATNYPLVRIINKATGDVQYCRTFGHSTMAIATGSAIVSTNFAVPANMETGASTLEVVANGIKSKAVSIFVDAAGSDVTSSVSVTASALTASNNGFAGTIKLTNTGKATIKGPLQVLFNGLPSGVTLANASGVHSGVPYLTSTVAQLKPKGTVTLTVQFNAPSASAVTYTAQVHSGTF
jgi:hypothetical protein